MKPLLLEAFISICRSFDAGSLISPLQMMSEYHAMFECIMRAFVPPLAAASTPARALELCASYPRVQELMLQFGSSPHSPLLAYVRHTSRPRLFVCLTFSHPIFSVSLALIFFLALFSQRFRVAYEPAIPSDGPKQPEVRAITSL